jgi:hypothetical protein
MTKKINYDPEVEPFAASEKKYYEQLEKAMTEYKAKWPNHCKVCGGWGMFYFIEHGERLEEPCENLPDGTCHRCGLPDTVSENKPCSNCGWYFDDGIPTP